MNKHGFWGDLKGNLQRAMSGRFLLAVVFLLIVNVVSVLSEANNVSGEWIDVIYLMDGFVFDGPFSVLVCFLGVIPYAHVFCEEWNHQFVKPSMIRNSVIDYSMVRVIAVYVSSYLAMLLGYLLTIGLFHCKYPLLSEMFTQKGSHPSDPAGAVGAMMYAAPFGFLLLRCSLHCAANAFWAVVALWGSTYFTSTFTTYSIPVLGYFFFVNSFRWLPTFLRLNTITRGFLPFRSAFACWSYATLFYTGFAVLFGIGFCLRVKERVKNG